MADLTSTEVSYLRLCLNRLALSLAENEHTDAMTSPLSQACTLLQAQLSAPEPFRWEAALACLDSQWEGLPADVFVTNEDEESLARRTLQQALQQLNACLETDEALQALAAAAMDDELLLPSVDDEDEPDLADLIAAAEAAEAATKTQQSASVSAPSKPKVAAPEPEQSEEADTEYAAETEDITTQAATAEQGTQTGPIEDLWDQLAELETVTRDLGPIAAALAKEDALPQRPTSTETLNFADIAAVIQAEQAAAEQKAAAKAAAVSPSATEPATSPPSVTEDTPPEVDAAEPETATQTAAVAHPVTEPPSPVEVAESPVVEATASAAVTEEETQEETAAEANETTETTAPAIDTDLQRFAHYIAEEAQVSASEPDEMPAEADSQPPAEPAVTTRHAMMPREMPSQAGAYFAAVPWTGVIEMAAETVHISAGAEVAATAEHYRKLTSGRINPLLIATKNAIQHSERNAVANSETTTAPIITVDFQKTTAKQFFTQLPWAGVGQ